MARYKIEYLPVVNKYCIWSNRRYVEDKYLTLPEAIKAKRRLIKQDKERKEV